MDNELLVKTIRTLCKNNDISISQLENDLEFGAGLISRWVKSSPSIDKIVAIADYFHISLDDVIGRTYSTNDEFLISLINSTLSNDIVWHSYNNNDTNEMFVKQYHQKVNESDFWDFDEYLDYVENYDECSYYTKFTNGYISIYGCYRKQYITKPKTLILFIQPDNDSELVQQEYSTNELTLLWLKILPSLGEQKPDEIKAVELREKFVVRKQYEQFLQEKKKRSLSLDKVINGLAGYYDNSLNCMIETLTNPEFTKAIENVSKAIQNNSMINKENKK